MEKIEIKRSLERLLELSIKQGESLQEGRMTEALSLQEERETLAEKMSRAGLRPGPDDEESAELISKILDNDKRLTLIMTDRQNEISEKLHKRMKSKPAIAAYYKGSTS